MSSEHLGVEVGETAGCSVGERHHLARVERRRVEVVVQRTVLVVLSDEKQLRPRTSPLDVGCHEACNTESRDVTRLKLKRSEDYCDSNDVVNIQELYVQYYTNSVSSSTFLCGFPAYQTST